jgi:hypothetical protein
MDDLKLCKAIAKIEERHVTTAINSTVYPAREALYSQLNRKSPITEYNPLTNKELLFDLLVKYEVEADFDEKEVVIYVYTTEGNPILKKFRESFTDKEDIKVAILKVIIKAYGEPE